MCIQGTARVPERLRAYARIYMYSFCLYVYTYTCRCMRACMKTCRARTNQAWNFNETLVSSITNQRDTGLGRTGIKTCSALNRDTGLEHNKSTRHWSREDMYKDMQCTQPRHWSRK